jgi:hypothetical protein
MPTTLAVGQIKAVVGWDFQNVLTVGNTSNPNTDTYSKSMTNGTGATGTADLMYSTQTTIAGGGTLNIDLAGSLTDFFGNVITFARIKVMKIELTTDTTATSILIGDHASPWATWLAGTNPRVRVYNGGCMLLAGTNATMYAVTAGSADGLKIVNEDGSNTATVKITLIGSTA